MTVIVYEKHDDGEVDVYNTFYFSQEYGLYDDKEEKFAHYMWNLLVKKEFGADFRYISNYDKFFTLYGTEGRYEGDGIYQEGKVIMNMDMLNEGISEIQLDDYLYFIEK